MSGVMQTRSAFWHRILLSLCLTLVGASSGAFARDSRQIGEILSGMRGILQGTGFSSKLYYSSPSCNVARFYRGLPTKHGSGEVTKRNAILAIRDLFGRDSDVDIDVYSPNVITVNVGHTATKLLRTKIGTLSLDILDQYNAILALAKLQNTAEFRAEQRREGISPLDVVYGYPLRSPSAHAPHLPRLLKDITAEQFLDLVAETYDGTVVYESCPASNRFYIGFISSE